MTGAQGSGGGAGRPSARELALSAARSAAAKQAEDVVILDVHELIVITDYFVICSAPTQRQVKTVIEAVEDGLRALGERPLRREGEDGSGWWLLDYVDAVVHVFGTEEREYYDLERLWRDGPRLEWDEKPGVASGE